MTTNIMTYKNDNIYIYIYIYIYCISNTVDDDISVCSTTQLV
jgi:hypothetical protein